MRFGYFLAVAAGCCLLTACDSSSEGGYFGEDGGMTADFIATAGDRVFFAFNRHRLTSDARGTLDRQVAWLLAHPDKAIVVEGHCDERGTREYNLALGERRAHEAVSYLVSKGLSESRVSAVSYGKDRPIEIPGAGKEEFWKQNRTAIVVLR